MKRSPPQSRTGVSSGDPFFDLAADQLATIGAVALMYNSVESRIDDMLAEGLRIPIQPAEVLSRINGVEGKVALIKFSAAHWGFSDKEQLFLAEALGDAGFMMLKRWRDAVIHARLFDFRTGVARVPERQGRTSEVLLSLEALEGLYNRLVALKNELWSLWEILERRSRLTRGGISDQHRERLERENSGAWAQAHERREYRLSLPPMPSFPEDIPPFGQPPSVRQQPSRE
ncbi:hypothetical protein LZ016_06580 [Sphingomonas sp. SM33]|uniref:Uncharacterized protein n=1 Tax=Sphingomonas telluris TaxID=2907998 RepID=A0ABS9VLC1_9SPHN|nr:hypothetical protein [Sphingomonas telluris]MCH8615765.1 hypothetical protein [Sphingomonas telluris]